MIYKNKKLAIRQKNFRRKRAGKLLSTVNRSITDLDGVCDICGKPEPREGYVLSVDHCHKTDKVRGVLCSTCNRALGLLKDNPQLLAKLVVYLLE